MSARSVMMGAALAASLLMPAGAYAGDIPFSGLDGAWSGTGSVQLENGKSERLKCKGYYNAKDASAIGMAISCGSAAFKINMRAKLAASGSRIIGTWEEREFNQAGNLSGEAAGAGFKLHFTGAVSGTISVVTSGSSQTVSISSSGAGFSGVKLQFARNG
jgi:hypothetical protein